MRYLSVCSGIEAASAAAPEGWHAAAYAEIEPFPSAVLAHRFPSVPNLGDFTKIEAHHVGTIDLLVGGTPCQSFSVAGKRAGLDDPRGNLTLEFLALARRLRPKWIVWENVPGVLSIDGGRTFGAFLGVLGQLGYGFAYRVLDAQHFGVPQRRRRVFVVGCAGGDWQRAAAVLFEPESLRGNPTPGGKARKDVAGALGASSGGADDARRIAPALTANYGKQPDSSNTSKGPMLIAHALRGEGFDASEDGTGRGTPLVAQCVTTGTGRRYDAESETLIAFDWQGSGNQGDLGASLPGVGALGTTKTPAVFDAAQITSGVRRLTPRECERLQGFPDGWTDVPYRGKPAADGPRYKAVGNSMAVPVMRWIFNRLDFVDRLQQPAAPPPR